MRILICGGTGTLGKSLIPLLLEDERVERIRILSRGEHTQMWLNEVYRSPKIDWLIGDIRDHYGVLRASRDCDTVYHFAAMKSVDKAEYNPDESISINITGTQNVIRACIENGVKTAVFTSTDKAVAPLNIYGSSKLCAEKLWIAGNIGKHDTNFSVMRYGNVFSSNGSVIQRWKRAMENGLNVEITDGAMTRFWILPQHAAKAVLSVARKRTAGAVFIPKMKSSTISALYRACKDAWAKNKDEDELITVGHRPGEKIHEVLIGEEEVRLTTDIGDFYVRWPNNELFPVSKHGTPMERGFTSHNAERFTHDELVKMCMEAKFD